MRTSHATHHRRITILAALAVAHLAFFQFFLFANTDFAEALAHFCHRAATPSNAAVPSSHKQQGLIHVSLPHHS
jgi:hypothetical protein